MRRRSLAVSGLALLLSACSPSPLQNDLRQESEVSQTGLPAPQISPPGGTFRTFPASGVSVLGSGGTTALLATWDGTFPAFNQAGQVRPPTLRWDSATRFLADLGPGPGPAAVPGAYTLRVCGWNGVQATAEARADFHLVGDGGTAWARADLVPAGGQTLGVATGPDGSGYAAGWTGVGSQAFLVRTDPAGTPLGTPVLLAAGSRFNGLAADPATGQVVAVGQLSTPGQTYDFGNGVTLTLPSGQGSAGFFVVLSPDLKALWAMATDLPGTFEGAAVTTLSGVQVALVAGTIQGPGTVVLGQTGVPLARTGDNGVLYRADLGSQTVLEAFTSGTVLGQDRFHAVAADRSGQTFVVAGSFNDGGPGFSWDGGTTTVTGAPGFTTPFVLGGGLGGTSLAAAAVRAPSPAPAANGDLTSVALDATGHGAAGGWQSGTATFAWGGTHSWAGGSAQTNGVVVEFTADATAAITSVAGPVPAAGSSSQVTAVVYDSQDRLHIAGTLPADSWTWGTAQTTTWSAQTPFLTRESGTSTVDWIRIPASAGAGASSLCLGADTTFGGRLLVGGDIQPGAVDYGAGIGVTALGTAPAPLVGQVFD